MVNPKHVQLAATAKRLIDENGVTVQLWREVVTGGTDYDPNAGTVTIETADVIVVRSKFSNSEVGDGSRIKSTDIKYLLDSDINPNDYEKVIDGTDELQIIDSPIIEPGEISILYKVQARL